MGAEGMQITIPDFGDDEDFGATPVFGRPKAGGLWGGTSSGQNSPTVLTPLALPDRADKTYFHSRNDSAASEDSTSSLPFSSRRVKAPFAHSAQSSIATTNTTNASPFTKKTSFASLRNAFKSSKSNDPAPPVPSLDYQAYPDLKNPFGRSTSSLAQLPPPGTERRRPSVQASPPQLRPSTPSSADFRGRGTPSKSRSHHAYTRSQHSHTGSMFHSSDGGSDHGHGLYQVTASPPPVPPVPSAFGHPPQSHERSFSESDDQIAINPRTPADYALHAIFIRFASSAETAMNEFLRLHLEEDSPLLNKSMGPGVDAELDSLLAALGKVASKHAKAVIDSILRWKHTQTTHVSQDMVSEHMEKDPYVPTRRLRFDDVILALNERKSLASVYLTCRALLASTQAMSKDALNESSGATLENLIFDQFSRPETKMVTQAVNMKLISDLYAALLTNLGNLRFESVTDHFMRELNPILAGIAPKDADVKYENLTKGLAHVPIKVWPPEDFEEGADFLARLSKAFENAHGFRLKTAFAESLVQILHPIGKTAQAEVNNPDWAKAIESIYPRTKDMMSKPRYWHVAYPLAVTALCVAPHEYFLRNWVACFDAGFSKIKERSSRNVVLNAMMRLVWTYLYRCHESPATAATKLETLMKQCFPANRVVGPLSDDQLQPLVCVIHFVLFGHFDFGSEFCLELLRDKGSGGRPQGASSGVIHERMTIAIRAVLLTIQVAESEDAFPSWPASSDYSALPLPQDYPVFNGTSLDACLLRPGWKEFLETFRTTLNGVAKSCYQGVGKWSVLDEQWAFTRYVMLNDEDNNFVTREHREGVIAYPGQSLPQIHLLQAVYSAWPCCLEPGIPSPEAYDMLIQGLIHVEPAVIESAVLAQHRFLKDPSHVAAILPRFTSFLFDPSQISRENHGFRLHVECARLLAMWLKFLDQWTNDTVQMPAEDMSDEVVAAIVSMMDDLEAAALFLLSHLDRDIYTAGVKAVRLMGVLSGHLQSASQLAILDGSTGSSRLIDALDGKISSQAYLQIHHDLLEVDEISRLEQWQQSAYPDVTLRLADSDRLVDRQLWRHVFPCLLQLNTEQFPRTITGLRDKLAAGVLRYCPVTHLLSGINTRTAGNRPQRSGSTFEREPMKITQDEAGLVQQWHMWLRLLCASAEASDARSSPAHSRDDTRGRFDLRVDKDQMATTRPLFRYLSHFLDSDHSLFRDLGVLCISSFPPHAYSHLLEDLSVLASRQIYDDSRQKVPAPSAGARTRRQERFDTAVARIYFLTARLLGDQRSSGRQAALAQVLKYVRNRQTYLTERRELYSLQRLRRYFCGVVERLFDGLATLKDSDRFIPPNMPLSLYKLCEEWCQLGKQSDNVKKRLVTMQTQATHAFTDPASQAEMITRFQTETVALSNASIGAMAALCYKAFGPPEPVSNSPSDTFPLDRGGSAKDSAAALDRMSAILASFHEPQRIAAKKALTALLSHPPHDLDFIPKVLTMAFVITQELNSSNARFFDIVADIICNTSDHPFTFSQVVCLGLSNLCNSASAIRRRAFNMLEFIHEQSSGLISMSQYGAAVESSAPGTYLNVHRMVSDLFAGEHPAEAGNVLIEIARWLSALPEGLPARTSLLLLQSLEYWVSSVDLMASDKSGLTTDGRACVYHMIALTHRFSESHPEQIQQLWIRLVDVPHQSNGYATIRFLLEQAQVTEREAFIGCATKIVAYLTHSSIGRQIFEELSSLIEPARMLPSYEHKVGPKPPEEVTELWSDFDDLFPERRKVSLGGAQYSLLFLSDSALERYWPLECHLPRILHALFVHLDNREEYIRIRCRHMLFQLLRCCVSGYDDVQDRSLHGTPSQLRDTIGAIAEANNRFWTTDDPDSKAEPLIGWLAEEVLRLLDPLYPQLRGDWAQQACAWATTCTLRPIAVRSLQVYRALSCKVNEDHLGAFIGRLSATIAQPEPTSSKDREQAEKIWDFNVHIIRTITSSIASEDLDVSLWPQMFWCAVAALSTTVEYEFRHVLELLDKVLSRMNLDDPRVTDMLLAQTPVGWEGQMCMQPYLMTGLRSSTTSALTFKILKSLAKIEDSRLIDPSEGRLRDLYTLALPYCLHAMVTGSTDESLQELAMDIARLASEEERPSIERIMTSFAKARFRTKEDFLRQSVSSLREHYGADHWTAVITLLMSLVLNKERWLRIHTMQILKVLFQQRETRNPVDLLGSELLMPLLRLVDTDLAMQALDVLDEPMQISGGPAAKHILRMSLHTNLLAADTHEVESVAEVFGIPQESGWCVARAAHVREVCRANVAAVFGLNKANLRPSRIDFQPEDVMALLDIPDEDVLGYMVQNLHELSSFFQEEQVQPAFQRKLEARVAAILAKSTDAAPEIPQTPFEDVFDVATLSPYEESDESDSDSSSDLFEFDSFAAPQAHTRA